MSQGHDAPKHRCPWCLRPAPREMKLAERAENVVDWLVAIANSPTDLSAGDAKKTLYVLRRRLGEYAHMRMGRPTKAPTAGERMSLGLKVTADIKQRLDTAAQASGRTQSQEAELRLERSFEREDLLPQVLALAYGKEIAADLMWLGETMALARRDREDPLEFARDLLKKFPDLDRGELQRRVNSSIGLLHAAKEGKRK